MGGTTCAPLHPTPTPSNNTGHPTITATLSPRLLHLPPSHKFEAYPCHYNRIHHQWYICTTIKHVKASSGRAACAILHHNPTPGYVPGTRPITPDPALQHRWTCWPSQPNTAAVATGCPLAVTSPSGPVLCPRKQPALRRHHPAQNNKTVRNTFYQGSMPLVNRKGPFESCATGHDVACIYDLAP